MREVVKELTRPALRRGAAPETAWAFFNGGYVPLAEAKVSVLSHAFNYGTGVFEGIRAYWNAEAEQLYGLHLIEHFQRLHRSARIMKIELERSPEQLRDITVELLRRCGYREDAYVRPIAYKSSELIGVRLHDLESGFTVFAVPFGTYIDIDHGISCGISSWRRIDDNAIPARAKITGSYVNEGIVRASVMRIATDEGIPLDVRQIDRTELYVCDELFLCGTGAQISPVTSVDHRPVSDGQIGPVTKRISAIYFDAVHGKGKRYREWLTPIYR